jgi:hypothetical protein
MIDAVGTVNKLVGETAAAVPIGASMAGPGSIAGADSRAAKKVRIPIGVYNF